MIWQTLAALIGGFPDHQTCECAVWLLFQIFDNNALPSIRIGREWLTLARNRIKRGDLIGHGFVYFSIV